MVLTAGNVGLLPAFSVLVDIWEGKRRDMQRHPEFWPFGSVRAMRPRAAFRPTPRFEPNRPWKHANALRFRVWGGPRVLSTHDPLRQTFLHCNWSSIVHYESLCTDPTDKTEEKEKTYVQTTEWLQIMASVNEEPFYIAANQRQTIFRHRGDRLVAPSSCRLEPVQFELGLQNRASEASASK
jgi:hypothetical protein